MLADVDGINVGDHIRRMLGKCITDKALKFTFNGYGPSAKRPKAKAALGKRKLMRCIFGTYTLLSINSRYKYLANLAILTEASKKCSATSKEKELNYWITFQHRRPFFSFKVHVAMLLLLFFKENKKRTLF